MEWQNNHIHAATLVRTVDGDTVILRVALDFHMTTEQRFRLARINAPELHSKDPAEVLAGQAAMSCLDSLLAGKPLTIRSIKTDDYGRWLVEIATESEQVNDAMLSSGHAKPYAPKAVV